MKRTKSRYLFVKQPEIQNFKFIENSNNKSYFYDLDELIDAITNFKISQDWYIYKQEEGFLFKKETPSKEFLIEFRTKPYTYVSYENDELDEYYVINLIFSEKDICKDMFADPKFEKQIKKIKKILNRENSIDELL